MHYPLDNVEQPLYVLLPQFNPQRYKRAEKLPTDALKMVRDAGAIPLMIEASFGERTSALDQWATPAELPTEQPTYTSHGPTPVPISAKMPPSRLKQDHIKVRVDYMQEVWLKECLLNIGLQHLPPDWKYVAWVDADVLFARPDWVSETLHQLQHYHFVQMFSIALDLSPAYEPIAAHQGFIYSYQHGYNPPPDGGAYSGKPGKGNIANRWHSGYAWAARRDALEAVGGFLDIGILGAGDKHMATALIGQAEEFVPNGIHPNYLNHILAWQDRAEKHIERNVGYVQGTLLHYWHGSKHHRQYFNRWKILIQNQFDPNADIYKDTRGLWRLVGNKPKLRDQLRAYFKQRNQDSIDMLPADDKLGLISDINSQFLPW